MTSQPASAPSDLLPPIRYQRPTPERRENEILDWDSEWDSLQAPRLSSTTLARATGCMLRAVYKILGKEILPPSPFSQSMMEDGKAFETIITQDKSHRDRWVQALCKAADLELPEDWQHIHEIKAVRQSEQESLPNFANRAKAHTLKEIKAVFARTEGAPFMLLQSTLVEAIIDTGAVLNGLPDVLIWAGTKTGWLIGDIKCAEEARSSHGIQVASYHRMLEGLLPDLPESMRKISSTGFIVHCAPGYRYVAHASEAHRQRSLAHLQVTCFEIEHLKKQCNYILQELLQLDAHSIRAIEDASNFTKLCIECECRKHCYPRFLNPLHLSLLPLSRAELTGLHSLGLHSLDDLIRACAIKEEGSTLRTRLLELRSNHPLLLRLLHDQAVAAQDRHGDCTWRKPDKITAQPLFFASCQGESRFFYEPETLAFSCLVVYSEVEYGRAWAMIKSPNQADPALQSILQRSGYFPCIILSSECQRSLHFPLPSLTLRPLAKFCRAYPDIQWDQLFTQGSPTEPLEDSNHADDRLQDLITVWEFMLTHRHQPNPLQ
jgi:hypothetical protein